MDMDLFFKKVYTVAFRLIAEEEMAEEMATQAIIYTFKGFNKNNKVTENMLQLTIMELIKIFLNSPNMYCNDNLEGVQKALIALKPVNRALVIWKDVLGYKIHDNIPLSNFSYEMLYKELVCGRKELKEYISSNI